MKNFILTTMLLLSFMLLIPQAKAGVVFMTGNKLVESMREYEKLRHIILMIVMLMEHILVFYLVYLMLLQQ